VQALVLAGGEGTRLRPLTLTVPKPIMPLAGRPFLSFMLDWLARHGVDEAILSCGFMADEVEQVLGDEHRGMRLLYVNEDEPLGTAGPVRLAADRDLVSFPLLVLNGDVLTDIDLTAQLERHEASGAAATLALVAVDDTSSYGVVPTDAAGRVEAFLEKSAGPAPTNRINAGAYVLDAPAVDAIARDRAVSFEREVFPALVEQHALHGYESEGYWIDIGTPERYLEATLDLLSGRVASELPPRRPDGSLILTDSDLGDASVGPLSVVGEGCEIGAGSVVERAVLHPRVTVGAGCSVVGCVLAEGVVVEDGARVEPVAVVGGGATVLAGTTVPGGERVAPGART
jgi:mannose-1-phosphate guanylyltransferase